MLWFVGRVDETLLHEYLGSLHIISNPKSLYFMLTSETLQEIGALPISFNLR